MEEDIVIRDADISDAKSLTSLAGQLGYKCSEDEVKGRLSIYQAANQKKLLVACCHAGVVGWMSLGVENPFYMAPYVRISGLVVEEGFRGKGIGKRLIGEAQSWARRWGIGVIRLNANVIRQAAHRFYKANGFENVKGQYVFEKKIR